jgi:hypothetical protein
VPGDDGGALRVRIGGFARTFAKTLVDPMLGAVELGFKWRLREDGRVVMFGGLYAREIAERGPGVPREQHTRQDRQIDKRLGQLGISSLLFNSFIRRSLVSENSTEFHTA